MTVLRSVATSASSQEEPVSGSSITVVVPCYNYGRYLKSCVESILSQGVLARIDVIDDCSSDDTERVGLSLAASYENVTFTRHPRNLGHIATYNEGLERAEGKYVLLLSADDLLAPGSLVRALEVLDANPDVALLYGDVVQFSDTAPPVGRDGDSNLKIWAGQDFIIKCCAEIWNPISTPTAVVRTTAQKAVGGYRPSLPHSGDREMWLRLATQGKVAELAGPTQAYYRLHENNMHRQWFYDPLVNDRETRLAYETFFVEYGPRLVDRERIRNLYAQGMSERGVWWSFEKLKRLQVRDASRCLRFAASVWHGMPEEAIGLFDASQFMPLSFAIRQRQRRRRLRSAAVS